MLRVRITCVFALWICTYLWRLRWDSRSMMCQIPHVVPPASPKESRGRRRVTVFGGNLDGFVSCIPADAYARHRLLEHPISWNMAKNIYIIISLFWSRSRPSARASLYQVSRCTTVATLFFTLRIANVRVDAHLDAVRAQKKYHTSVLLKHTSGARRRSYTSW